MPKLAATGPDVFCYFLRETADSTLRSIVKFQGRLPLPTLKKSIQSVIDNHWVLTSNIEFDGKGWMNWIYEPDISSDDCILEHWVEESDPEPFLFHPIDDGKAPQLHLDLLHGPKNDLLVISSPHFVLDGKGMKELTLMILSGCAGHLMDYKVSGFLPRSELPIWNNLDEESLKKVSEDVQWPYCSWPTMYHKLTREGGKLLKRNIKIEDLNAVRHSLPEKVTIHDMLMASFYQALVEVLQGKHCTGISSTVDNRRYMPKGAMIPDIANISSSYSMAIPGNLNDFKEVVNYIYKEHLKKKDEKIGLSNLLTLSKAKDVDEVKQMVDEMNQQGTQEMAQYFLSNLGTLEVDENIIDELGVEEVYFSYPGINPPTVGITVSTFNGVMNLNTGYYSGVNLPIMEQFLDTIVHYLVSGINKV